MPTIFASYSLKGSDVYELSSTAEQQLLNPAYKLNAISKEEIKETSDKFRQFSRSLARDGYLALACLEQVRKHIPEKIKPDRLGLYTAFLNSAWLYPLLDQLKEMPDEEKFPYAKKNWPPKQQFRQNGPLRATHFAMTLNIHGPQMTFVDPHSGLIDAMNAAAIDLHSDEIDLAIVLGGFAFDDIQTVKYYSDHAPELSEAGICLLLVRDKKLIQWKLKEPLQYSEGLCSPVIQNKLLAVEV